MAPTSNNFIVPKKHVWQIKTSLFKKVRNLEIYDGKSQDVLFKQLFSLHLIQEPNFNRFVVFVLRK